jgi:hypothetical protein
MAKKCFLSFHYKPDNWRVSQVRQIGAIEEQPLLGFRLDQHQKAMMLASATAEAKLSASLS